MENQEVNKPKDAPVKAPRHDDSDKQMKIRVSNSTVKRKLQNIASHKGITLNSFMCNEIFEILKKYPEHMHSPLKH